MSRVSSMGSQLLFLRLVSVIILIGSCLDFSKSSSVLAPPCSTDKITKAKACIGFSMSFSRIWLRILLDLNCLKVELFSTRVARVSGDDCPSDRVHSRYELQAFTFKLECNFDHCTLLVLIDFCPVQSEFLTWSFAYYNFRYFARNYYIISDLGCI